jgi:hypothetical protein
MFTGALGRRRTFLVAPAEPKVSIPTDFSGVTYVTYDFLPDEGNATDMTVPPPESTSPGPGSAKRGIDRAAKLLREAVQREWDLARLEAEKATQTLMNGRRGAAIKRLHAVVKEITNLVTFLQSNLHETITNRSVFDRAKARAATKILAIAACFTEDAELLEIKDEFKGLVDVAVEAAHFLPFPRGLVPTPKEQTRRSLKIRRAVDLQVLRGGNPMRPLLQATARQNYKTASELGRLYGRWWNNYLPQLEQMATRLDQGG